MKANLKHFFLGDFDYKILCTPVWPYCTTRKRPNAQFFGKDEYLGILTAAVMGLQHALAVTGGLITPPLLIGLMCPDESIRTYLIQASLLVAGIMTFIQVTGIGSAGVLKKMPFQLGAGILSVMGVSFTTVPIAQSVLTTLMNEGDDFNTAYGKLLGSLAICGVIPIIFSFLPYRALRTIFPPIVCGVTIILIGINLTGTGMQYWGGGAFCGQNYKFYPTTQPCVLTDSTTNQTFTADCYNADVQPLCSSNGDVMLPFGSGEYVGLGFLVFATIVIIEVFGSPFMRNASVVIGLLFGYVIAAAITHDGDRYVTAATIDQAPVATFLWVHTFPLAVYGPAILPLLIVFCITSIETVGDISATEEASRLETYGEIHTRRTRGALLNDGVSGIFSALATSLPLTTFAQNNGVIALTNVASRWAGWACACWMFLLGLFGKFGGWVLSIPDCVLGGMTTFLFANVIASGIKIIVSHGSLHRRNRFIMACSLGMGIGVTLTPQWATNALWPITPDMSPGVVGLRNAIILVLQTGFCLGAVIAFILNLALPDEETDDDGNDFSTHEGAEIPDVSTHAKKKWFFKNKDTDTEMAAPAQIQASKDADAV